MLAVSCKNSVALCSTGYTAETQLPVPFAADLEERLELAAAEVTQMREAIGHMGQRLEARDKAVAAQLQVCYCVVHGFGLHCTADLLALHTL